MRVVEKMPAFPKSVHRVLELCSDINCAPRDLVQVIENDPIFTLKILKLVNSPYFGLVQKITSIHHAIVYVGLNTLKNVALGLASIGSLPRKNKAGFDMDAFWLHSLAVGTVSRMMATMILRLPQTEAGDYFVAGLLHDVGKVVFAIYMPEEFKDVLAKVGQGELYLYEAEKDVIGADHAEIGAMLAKKWALPDPLTTCIARHHSPDQGESDALTDCVFVANQVAKKLEFGSAGENDLEDVPESVLERFDMDLDKIISSMPALEDELKKARIFITV